MPEFQRDLNVVSNKMLSAYEADAGRDRWKTIA